MSEDPHLHTIKEKYFFFRRQVSDRLNFQNCSIILNYPHHRHQLHRTNVEGQTKFKTPIQSPDRFLRSVRVHTVATANQVDAIRVLPVPYLSLLSWFFSPFQVPTATATRFVDSAPSRYIGRSLPMKRAGQAQLAGSWAGSTPLICLYMFVQTWQAFAVVATADCQRS